jgi:hypothetical protein
MCRRIVADLDGRMRAESPSGVRSNFFFTLPKADNVPKQPQDESEAISS